MLGEGAALWRTLENAFGFSAVVFGRLCGFVLGVPKILLCSYRSHFLPSLRLILVLSKGVDVMAEILVNTVQTSINMLNGLDHSATVITVADASIFPAASAFRVAVDNEIILVAAIASNDLTVTRGVEGTVAMAHLDGSLIVSVLTAGALNSVLGGGGSGGGLTAAQSVSVKSFMVNSGNPFTFQTNIPFNGYQNGASNGDVHGVTIFLVAGTYELHVNRWKQSNQGIVQMSVAAANVGAAYDCYVGAGSSWNAVVVGFFVVAADSFVDIAAIVTGKNPSSTDYFCLESSWAVVRTV